MEKVKRLYVVPLKTHWETTINLPCEFDNNKKHIHYIGKDTDGNYYIKCMHCRSMWLVKPNS